MASFYARLLCLIVWLTEQIFPIACDVDDEVEAIFTEIRFGGIKIRGENIFMAELKEGQQLTAAASLRTQSGHDAAYQSGSATWESSDPSIATVEANPTNELEATVKGVDGSANGSVVVTFRADGDPDAEETRDLVATLDVVVTKGEAFVAELSAGMASDIPTPSPEPPPEG